MSMKVCILYVVAENLHVFGMHQMFGFEAGLCHIRI